MRFLTHWVPVILWTALILVAANDTFSARNSGGWFRFFTGVELPYAAHVAVRKLAHLVEYGILAALAWRASPRAAVALGIALTVAVADESIQSMSTERTGTPWDVAIDLAGAAIAVALLRRR